MESSDNKQAPPHWATISSKSWEWLAGAKARVNDLVILQKDWDGEGSPPIREDIMDAVKDMLLNIMGSVPQGTAIPFVVPISGGYLQLEWQGDRSLELEFDSPTEIIWLTAERKDGELKREHMESGRIATNAYGKICRMITWLGG